MADYNQSSWDELVDWTQKHSALLGIGGAIASGILSAYLAQQQADQQAQLVRELIDTITARIAEAEAKIIDTLEELSLEGLEGNLRGIVILWSEYEPIPEKEADLQNIIQVSALIQGNLEVKMEHPQTRRQDALRAYSLYANVLMIRLAALAERKRAYNIDEDAHILKRLREARGKVDLMQVILRKLVNDQCITRDIISPGTIGILRECACQGQRVAYANELLEPGVVDTACEQFKAEAWEEAAKSHREFEKKVNEMTAKYTVSVPLDDSGIGRLRLEQILAALM
jgi:hypothetical protein